MHHFSQCALNEFYDFGQYRSDGWDSSLDKLWQLELQGRLDTSLPAENTVLELPCASVTVGDAESDAIVSERRLHNRRVAQKRFRLREKERKCTVESQLEKTRRELQRSQSQQAALEAELVRLKGFSRNITTTHEELIQQCQCTQTGSRRDSVALPDYVQGLLLRSHPSIASTNGAATPADAELPFADVRPLYQAIMYQLSEVLSSCEPDGLLPTRLTELSLRACSLLFSQLPSNLPVLVDFHFTGIGKTDLIPADYAGSKSALLTVYGTNRLHGILTTLCQQSDLVCSGHLHRAREAALQALSDCDGDLHKVKACTDRLQSVVEATYHTYLQFGAAFAFGVHTSRQLAVGLVYSFPRLFGMEFCEFLAELHGAPTVDSLFSLSNTEPTVLSWADLKACLLRIGPDNLHTYIPLRQAVCDNITGPSLLF